MQKPPREVLEACMGKLIIIVDRGLVSYECININEEMY